MAFCIANLCDNFVHSITSSENSSHLDRVEDESTVGREVTSLKVIRFGFDSHTSLHEHSHSTQEASEDIPVLRYQEFEYTPIQMDSNVTSTVHVERREEHYKNGELVSSHVECDDEPFAFDRVEYASEPVENFDQSYDKVEYGSEPDEQIEQISTDPIMSAVTTTTTTTRTETSGSKEVSRRETRTSTQNSATSEPSPQLRASQAQEQLGSSKGYQAYSEVMESTDSLSKASVEEKELVPHLVRPKVRDNPRPVMLDKGVYRYTEYKFKSRSDKDNAEGQIIQASDSEAKKHSQTHHTRKDHRHRRSESQEEVEIRTSMHSSPASTLVRQSTRPNMDLPPSTGAVRMLRDRIETGENNEHKKPTTKEIDIFESLNETAEAKNENDYQAELDERQAELSEQKRHTFHELYYRQPIEIQKSQVKSSHYQNSTIVTTRDARRHGDLQPDVVNLRHVNQTSAKNTSHHYSGELVNLRTVNQSGIQSSNQYNETVQQTKVYPTARRETMNQYNQSIEQVNLRPAQKGIHNVYNETMQQEKLRSVYPPARREATNQYSQYNQFEKVNPPSVVGGENINQYGQYIEEVDLDQSAEKEIYNPYADVALRHVSQPRRESSGRYSQSVTEQVNLRNVSQTTGRQTTTSEQSYVQQQVEPQYQQKQVTQTVTRTSGQIQTNQNLYPQQAVTRQTYSYNAVNQQPQEVAHSPGIHIGGVVGNVVDNRTAQGEVYTTRTSTYVPQKQYVTQERQITLSPVPTPTEVAPTASARTSRAHDEKFNSMRVVRNVRAFVNEWGQKDFVPPGGKPQLQLSPRAIVSPTFSETKVTSTVQQNVTQPAQRVVTTTTTTTTAPPKEHIQTRTDVSKQTIVKTESHEVGGGNAAQRQQLASTAIAAAPVPAKRESVVIARARSASPPVTDYPQYHHEYHCCYCPYHHDHYASEHQSQPMLKYESYAVTPKVEEHYSRALHHPHPEEHREHVEEEESFTLVPVSVRRADYEQKSGQTTTKKTTTGMKPMIDVFSV
ncbi:unnamed protein product [Strongylus vulgaris]|uniref:Uncharacterized protein n=1 Tax=Strongylus vulgaris TaxID=40348 RepID=A0A3P7J9W8_STRVU|nr:unnamed protein product [Strongylus vulgaris]